VGNYLLGVLLTRSLRSVEVHDSIAVITALATTVVVVGASGLLVEGLLVVVTTSNLIQIRSARYAIHHNPRIIVVIYIT
jgi:hypothetical protein